MKRKTSPRERQATQADVNRAKRDATGIAIQRCLRMVAYVLMDKRGASADDVQGVIDGVEHLAGHINAGRMSWGDVNKVLDEYGILIKMVGKSS